MEFQLYGMHSLLTQVERCDYIFHRKLPVYATRTAAQCKAHESLTRHSPGLSGAFSGAPRSCRRREAEVSAELCIEGVCSHRWKMQTSRNARHRNGESGSSPRCRHLARRHVTIRAFVDPSPAERKTGDLFEYFLPFDSGTTLPHKRSASHGSEDE